MSSVKHYIRVFFSVSFRRLEVCLSFLGVLLPSKAKPSKQTHMHIHEKRLSFLFDRTEEEEGLRVSIVLTVFFYYCSCSSLCSLLCCVLLLFAMISFTPTFVDCLLCLYLYIERSVSALFFLLLMRVSSGGWGSAMGRKSDCTRRSQRYVYLWLSFCCGVEICSVLIIILSGKRGNTDAQYEGWCVQINQGSKHKRSKSACEMSDQHTYSRQMAIGNFTRFFFLCRDKGSFTIWQIRLFALLFYYLPFASPGIFQYEKTKREVRV
ncbi:MAG: hypothetical protein BYD32DRAFT_1306 [Podila humilis]|nr:MAG: hypothetical protein BYD32DRAFT_1306 [Podila humilis]